MRSLIVCLFLSLATIATADPRDWAKRIPCELQTAGVASLPTLELLQGSTPLISADQYRSGKALTVTNDIQAVLRFSSSLTNTFCVSTTNQSYYGNSYLIQLPSLGTNAVNWVYTILYLGTGGEIYWTGTGRLDIKRSEVAGNALVWQEVGDCVTSNDIATAINTHNTSLLAHSTLLSSYITVADTAGWTVSSHAGFLTAETDPIWGSVSNTVTAGALAGSTAVQRTGDTLTGSLLTTIDHTTTAPANNELVSAGWVRGLAISGAQWYFTTNTITDYGKTENFTTLQDTTPENAFTNVISSPVLANTYLFGGETTNLYTTVKSPITFEVYMNRVGGNVSTSIGVHPEIYYVYNGTTNILGDYSVNDQVITATTPTRYTWVVSFPEPTVTGAVKIVGYLKSGTVSGTDAGLNIYGGDGVASHMNIQAIPTGISVHNDLSLRDASDAHPTSAITGLTAALGTITFTNGTTHSDGVYNGTNGVYYSKNGTNYWILLP